MDYRYQTYEAGIKENKNVKPERKSIGNTQKVRTTWKVEILQNTPQYSKCGLITNYKLLITNIYKVLNDCYSLNILNIPGQTGSTALFLLF